MDGVIPKNERGNVHVPPFASALPQVPLLLLLLPPEAELASPHESAHRTGASKATCRHSTLCARV